MGDEGTGWPATVGCILKRAVELQHAHGTPTSVRLLPDDMNDVIAAIRADVCSPRERAALRMQFCEDQLEAAATCIAFRVVFLLGNPGTGKTALAVFLRVVIRAIDKGRSIWATPLNRGRIAVDDARTLHSLTSQNPSTEQKMGREIFFEPPDQVVKMLGELPNFRTSHLWSYGGTVMCDEGAYGSLKLLTAIMCMAYENGGCFIAMGDMQQIMPIMSKAMFDTETDVADNPIYIMQTEAAHRCEMHFACLTTLHRALGITTDLVRAIATYSDEPIPSPGFEQPMMRPSEILATRVIDQQQALDMLREGNTIFLCARHAERIFHKDNAAKHRKGVSYKHVPVFRTKDTKKLVESPPFDAADKYPHLSLSVGDPVLFTGATKITERITGEQITTYNGQPGTVVSIAAGAGGTAIASVDVQIGSNVYRVAPKWKIVESDLLDGTMYARRTAGGRMVSTLEVNVIFLVCSIAATISSQQGMGYEPPLNIVTVPAPPSKTDHSDKIYVSFTRARELSQVFFLSAGAPIEIGPNFLSTAVDTFMRQLAREHRSLGKISRAEAAATIHKLADTLRLSKTRVTIPVPRSKTTTGVKQARSVHRMSVPVAGPRSEDAGEDSNDLWESAELLEWADACESGRPAKKARLSCVFPDPRVLAPGRVYVH